MELEGARVLVLGLGMTGRSAARHCAERGARVLAVDERPAAAHVGLDHPGIEVADGAFPSSSAFDLVVPSPGVPRERYAEGARRIWGDLELFYRATEIPIVAVTGTNGKSTTVRLIEAMLRSAGLRARAAGNVGEPALELLGQPLDAAVLEVSSFQLEAVDSFRPRVGVLLNLAPDHLDRHGSFEAYREAKARLFARQEPGDTAVLAADDDAVASLAPGLAADVRWFRVGGTVPSGAFFDLDGIVLASPEGHRRWPLPAMPAGLPRENLLAALVSVEAAGADPGRALEALFDFAPLPHRLEPVADHAGVRWIDDSKATNPGAAERALASQGRPVLWIAGGRNKGLDFGRLAEAAARHARYALLIGEASSELAAELGDRVAHEEVRDLAEAVRRAAALAREGDTVLLSPACASFDQFEGFEDRGRRFQQAVRDTLKQGQS